MWLLAIMLAYKLGKIITRLDFIIVKAATPVCFY